jgi:adenosylhomocysteine nucleosidase
VDTQSGERYSNSQFKQVLVSTPTIASIKEKQRLYESYRAGAVDMEAATVARIAEAHNLPFQAIKVISDDANFELQELARFATQDGQFRAAAFAAYSVAQPRLWSKLFHLAVNSKRAIQSLTVELESQLDWYRQRA